MAIIEGWELCTANGRIVPPGMAEKIPVRLSGAVYMRPGFADGSKVITSQIGALFGTLAVTESGTTYRMGKARASYAQKYPWAKRKLSLALKKKAQREAQREGAEACQAG